jgi:putative endopeptidase
LYIFSGFDQNGGAYDEFGNKKDWWSASASDEFNKRAQCFVDQYSKIAVNGTFVNGNQTINENIADNAGLSCKVYSKFD